MPVKRNKDSDELHDELQDQINDEPDDSPELPDDPHSHFPDDVRVKEEEPDDIVCLEDDPADVKSDALRMNSTFPPFTPQQNNPPYMPGLVPSMPPGSASHMSHNSNASWASTSKLPYLRVYEGGGTPGSASASWNAGDASVGATLFLFLFLCSHQAC